VREGAEVSSLEFASLPANGLTRERLYIKLTTPQKHALSSTLRLSSPGVRVDGNVLLTYHLAFTT